MFTDKFAKAVRNKYCDRIEEYGILRRIKGYNQLTKLEIKPPCFKLWF